MSDDLDAELAALYKRYELPDRPATDPWWDDPFAGLEASPELDPHKDLFRDWILRPAGFVRGRNGLLVWLDAELRRGAPGPEPDDDPYSGPPVAHLWSEPRATGGVGVYWGRDEALWALNFDRDAELVQELSQARKRGRRKRAASPARLRRAGARVSLDPSGEGAAELGSEPSPEIAAAVEDGAWLRVVTFVELEDGRRITDEAQGSRAFGFGPALWAVAIAEDEPVPDEADLDPPHAQRTLGEVADRAKWNAQRDWFPLRVALAEEGIDVEEADLVRLPFVVEIDEQLRDSLQP
jgi:hypothetical protein